MEIISITPRKTPNRPMIVKFQWNNGNPGYVEVAYGNIEFVRPVKKEGDTYWHFEKSGYKPCEKISYSVIKMIVMYSRAFIDDNLEKLRNSYSKAVKRQKEFFERNQFYSPELRMELNNIYSQAMDLKNGFKDIEILEKKWRGGNDGKAC